MVFQVIVFILQGNSKYKANTNVVAIHYGYKQIVGVIVYLCSTG